ncbi:MAG: hypothetical protein LBC86_06610 [Oscillospiraceae bacterium]|jgi:hypothetical protein|nr:hypothetical protein [Oscillospiraceae bacterium]
MAGERFIDEIKSTCDMACEILKLTHDGDDLEPMDLKLTESAVNGFLNKYGKTKFGELYKNVTDGVYAKPYLNGIEPFTRDHEGYIFYKGIHVEHYSSNYAYTERAKSNLIELKRRCEFLERNDVAVSSVNVIWRWEKYADEFGVEQLKLLNNLLDGKGLEYSEVELYNCGYNEKYYVCGKPSLEEIRINPVTQELKNRDGDDEYNITIRNYVYGDNENLTASDEIVSLLPLCHDYLVNHEFSELLSETVQTTDFGKNYGNVRKLDEILKNRSVIFTHNWLIGGNYDHEHFIVFGNPTLDEIKENYGYCKLLKLHPDDVRNYSMTYSYGVGAPITKDEIPDMDEFEELLQELYEYLPKHGLAKEIDRSDCLYDKSIEDSYSYEDYCEEEGFEP